MKNTLKSVVALFLVAVMALSFTACTESDLGGDQSDTQTNNQVSVSVEPTEKENDTWKMTYKNCKVMDDLDSLTTELEEGKQFLAIFFQIENVSQESQIFNIVYESFYVDGVKTTQSLHGFAIDDAYQLTSVTVEPGKKANGYFLLQVKPDWQEVEIVYNDAILSTDKDEAFTFKVTKNEA